MDKIDDIVSILKRENKKYIVPIVTIVSMTKGPFAVLISCLLSLRTKDKVTGEASNRLFKLADNPEAMLGLSTKSIEKAIYPVGFYKTKAKRIKEICKTLLDDYEGVVPDEIDELLKFKGVGRKTANLAHIHTQTNVHSDARILCLTHACTRAHTHTHAPTHTHTHTHTHTYQAVFSRSHWGRMTCSGAALF